MGEEISTPSYDLAEVQSLMRAGRYRYHAVLRSGCGPPGADESDIVDCVPELVGTDFYKTMESRKAAGLWQDVYRTTWIARPGGRFVST